MLKRQLTLRISYALLCIISIIKGQIRNNMNCDSNLDEGYVVHLKTHLNGFFCAGSLLSDLHVLTAGYCCTSSKFRNNIEVYVGLVRTKAATIQKATGMKRYIHPEVNACILEVRPPIKQKPNVSYVKIAPKETFDSLMKTKSCKESFSLGFRFVGSRSFMKDTHDIGYYCFDKCMLSLKKCANDTEIMCNGRHKDLERCSDHSGGPVICKRKQIGIVLVDKDGNIYVRTDGIHSFIKVHVSNGNSWYINGTLILLILFLNNIT